MKPKDKVMVRWCGQFITGTLVQKRLWGWMVTYDVRITRDGQTLYTEHRIGWFPNWHIWPNNK